MFPVSCVTACRPGDTHLGIPAPLEQGHCVAVDQRAEDVLRRFTATPSDVPYSTPQGDRYRERKLPGGIGRRVLNHARDGRARPGSAEALGRRRSRRGHV